MKTGGGAQGGGGGRPPGGGGGGPDRGGVRLPVCMNGRGIGVYDLPVIRLR